jgi:hypothetical protein
MRDDIEECADRHLMVVDVAFNGWSVVSTHGSQDDAERERDTRNEGLARQRYTACLALEPVAQGMGPIMRARILTRRGHASSVGFVRKIVQAARAAMAGSRWDLYRPELHYMRGPGPKSRFLVSDRSRPTTRPRGRQFIDLRD